MYIYQKQLEEADVIVLNKADLLTAADIAELEGSLKQEFPRAPVMTMSALAGEGVDAWLDFVLRDQPAGRTITAVDYDQYAEGEAALGWLNAAVRLQAETAIDWRAFCAELVRTLQDALRALPAEVAHLKLHLTAGEGTLVANLTSNAGEMSIRGAAGNSPQAVLLVNVRAHVDPDRLQRAVRGCLQTVSQGKAQATIDDLQSFSPARPQPKHRYESVV
jgi:G3E family GTPase